MGIVLKQSFLNTLILFLGFSIGGINVLFLFTHFLHEDYFGLITFLLSTATIILPLLVFGMQHSVIKFYSFYTSKKEQDSFLISTIFIPLLIIIPVGLIGIYLYDVIANWISSENTLIKDYTSLIFITAIFMGYFEVFYSWTKVKFNSVFGNFIKELFARICTSFLLIAVYFKLLTNDEFIYAIVLVYGIRAFIMKLYAFYVCRPQLVFKIPMNIKEILSFSLYIIVAGSAAGVLLEIDKFMIPQMEQIAEVAYYSVGIYIASVIAIPTRAMQHITTPITAKDMNENKLADVEKLYKQTSINLLVIGGLFFLLINLNISDLYMLINKPQFTKGIWIVFIISLAKLMELALGTGNAILVNSKYYKIFFYLSLAMAISVILLNKWLIHLIGINGAALATLIVVVFYTIFKILYIKGKLNIQPFSRQTSKVITVIIVVFGLFYFWNFSFHPILNIVLKSLILVVTYVVLIKKLEISKDINSLISKYLFFKIK
ncbi:MAG: oligosaccharide flippase family protein [Lutibacter sp.]|uniref:oligosaccharide flippase family protein n=1 Tax=Lutibacter sp. TaxID=1925666 RepID=UPI0017969006|nr:polysaccharide biosynthesis C-terminal domain-containing protein [Lutibacter sp.]MBT8317524.1 polysaccharide biosynthesis C-terminal domain-containing protein [Lutibacter sp.]NNJ58383.1 oligosaccharide flippase family protein [Lutibacter sp.]